MAGVKNEQASGPQAAAGAGSNVEEANTWRHLLLERDGVLRREHVDACAQGWKGLKTINPVIFRVTITSTNNNNYYLPRNCFDHFYYYD